MDRLQSSRGRCALQVHESPTKPCPRDGAKSAPIAPVCTNALCPPPGRREARFNDGCAVPAGSRTTRSDAGVDGLTPVHSDDTLLMGVVVGCSCKPHGSTLGVDVVPPVKRPPEALDRCRRMLASDVGAPRGSIAEVRREIVDPASDWSSEVAPLRERPTNPKSKERCPDPVPLFSTDEKWSGREAADEPKATAGLPSRRRGPTPPCDASLSSLSLSSRSFRAASKESTATSSGNDDGVAGISRIAFELMCRWGWGRREDEPASGADI
mmetsp:Transcript_14643/g.39741  ORF Transcript_14643/g.39741 Transcript_14643/m.39741 type:complete len:268 (-) Transcript_14643:493-1296(-)|eukprot:scaffold12959_cov28-Tisochrysis_lutea.AAC.3